MSELILGSPHLESGGKRAWMTHSFFNLAKLLELGAQGRIVRVPSKAAVVEVSTSFRSDDRNDEILPDEKF